MHILLVHLELQLPEKPANAHFVTGGLREHVGRMICLALFVPTDEYIRLVMR